MALSIEEKRELFEEFKKELMEAQKVYVEVCREGVELPQYANIGDAGMDIRAAEEVTVFPGETKIIPTGLKMLIPQGYELQVRPRRDLSVKTPLRMANTPGTIDSDEIGIIMQNNSVCYNNKTRHGSDYVIGGDFAIDRPYTIDDEDNKQGKYLIRVGDRVAQIVLVRFETIEFVPTKDVKVLGLNRGGVFGSKETK